MTTGCGDDHLPRNEFHSPNFSPISERNGGMPTTSPDMFKRQNSQQNGGSGGDPSMANSNGADIVIRASNRGNFGKNNGHRRQILDSPQAQALLRHGEGLDNPQL